MRRLILGGLMLSLLWPLAGCATVATMVVKHVAMKEGMKVAKSAYHGLKGDSTDAQKDVASPTQCSVVIASVPPGARIEVNGRRVGNAPVVVVMKLEPDGTVAGNYRIQAVPAQPGQNPQERRFLHYHGEPSDRAPVRVTFDMMAPPSRGATVTYNQK